jgi:hypothetical protein
MSDRRRLALVAAVALTATVAVYGSTLAYGFRYDDYFLFRPWTLAELTGVWSASWDPTGISVPFYRPLTAWWYAASFEIFGVNSTAMHAVSLALHAVCAVLVSQFLRREGVPWLTAGFGAVLYAVHPILVYAQTAWLTNQMHALASVTVLVTLLLWQRARTRSAKAWLVLLPMALVAFLIKEDTIMLVPVLLLLTALRRLMVERDAGPPLWQLAGATAVAVIALFGGRRLLLGEMGGYSALHLSRAGDWYAQGLQSVLRMRPWRRPWQTTAGTISTAGLVLAPLLAIFWTRTSRSVFVAATGLAIVLAFNLPFVLVSKAEQYHLLALGAVVALSGVADGLWRLVRSRWWRWGVTSVCALTLFAFGGVARHITGDFAPCHPLVLDTDPRWWVVPHEIQAWFDRKAAACRSGQPAPRLTDLPQMSWGVHDPEVENGAVFHWTGARPVFFFKDGGHTFKLLVRDPSARPDQPHRVRLSSGGERNEVTLRSGDWHPLTVPVSGRLAWLRGGSRAAITLERTFVPNERDPASPDMRRLGVQIRFDELR